MNLFNQQRPSAKPEHIQQLKIWTQDILNLPIDVPISISQLRCHEPDCPPVETVVAVMTQPTQTFKVHAAPEDIDRAMILQAINGETTD